MQGSQLRATTPLLSFLLVILAGCQAPRGGVSPPPVAAPRITAEAGARVESRIEQTVKNVMADMGRNQLVLESLRAKNSALSEARNKAFYVGLFLIMLILPCPKMPTWVWLMLLFTALVLMVGPFLPLILSFNS